MLAAVWRTDSRGVSLESGSGYEALAVWVEMMVVWTRGISVGRGGEQ